MGIRMCHVELMEYMRIALKIWVGKLEKIEILKRCNHCWKNGIETGLRNYRVRGLN
jgi:hypothetical protein